MITSAHLINEVRTIASSAGNSDDFKASDELILHWCNQVRSTLISQAIDKRNDILDIWIQNISCLELELVNSSECCDFDTDCFVLRSIKELPITIETSSKNMIIGVYTLDNQSIDELSVPKARYSKYTKYGAKRTGWYIKNNRLHIINNILLEKVTIAGIWDDPSELGNYISCDNQVCWSVDSIYPASLKMVESIIDIVVKTKCQTMMSFQLDNSNNASGSVPQQSQQSKTE